MVIAVLLRYNQALVPSVVNTPSRIADHASPLGPCAQHAIPSVSDKGPCCVTRLHPTGLMKLTALIVFIVTLVAPAAVADDAAEVEFFEKRVRPVLVQRCYGCHANDAKTIRGGLLVDSRDALLIGGDSGPAVVPGKPEESLLIEAVLFHDDADYQMPPKGKLPQREIEALIQWVKSGAPFPGKQSSPDRPASVPGHKREIDWEAERRFWSFVDVSRKPLPPIHQTDWPRRRIDQFVLAKMEQQKLQPSPRADRATLIRRLSFDLTGLPPTPDEVQAFLADSSPDAMEDLVDRLLASPRFGERWARVWLDLARYTDRTASWLDKIGDAHLYRDWVVRAMNEDVPYDQFIHRQLATDFLPETDASDIPALGFLGLSPNYWKELKLPSEIIKVIVADEWEERVDAVSRTYLGLTVACARCHDHKFDAITMQDYYALAGVFASCRIQGRPTIDESLYKTVQAASRQVAALNKEVAQLKKQQAPDEDKIAELNAQIQSLQRKTPHYGTPLAPAVVEETLFVERKGATAQEGTKLVYKPQPRDLHLFIRGNPNRPGEVVPRRFLAVLNQSPEQTFKTGSGRLELAQAITTDAASLTARVMVNRIWLAHFGRGLVTTPSNFGRSGERPSHPQLLDDLAARFIENGWSLKWLHREIVLSATYLQSSKPRPEQESLDPDNVWLARMNRRRLSIEAWRDAMLCVSGRLNPELGGPSIELADANNDRRTLYGTIHRRDMSTLLMNHDFPDPTSHSPQRVPTTTSLQGLYALNGPFILQQSEALASRLLDRDLRTDDQRIQLAYKLLFAREPSAREVELGLQFLGLPDSESEKQTQREIWIQYAHVLLASNEFAYLN